MNATNFHRFHVHLFNLFSPQLNNQADLDYLSSTLFLHFVNQNRLLNISSGQIDIDFEQSK